MPVLSNQGRQELVSAIADNTAALEFQGKCLPYITAAAASGVSSVAYTSATHGFATPQHVEVTINKATTAPTQCAITYGISGSTVTVYFWKFTGSGNTTLTADTGAISYTLAIWGTGRS